MSALLHGLPQPCSTSSTHKWTECSISRVRSGCVRICSAGRRHCPSTAPRLVLCAAAAPSAVEPKARPGEKKGFVEEMRFVAMKLHTKDQAPKEGERESAEKAWKQWQPSREGYLRFLTESKAVYDTMENIIAEAPFPEYARFQNTGLERAAPLAQDIAWMQQEYGLLPVQLQEDGPGLAYSKLLDDLARKDPPVFLCHFYNVYFAHTAGGRMIGAKVASMILDSKDLAFYRYEGDFRQKLDGVREALNAVADSWSREEKDRCLQETQKSFSYSGGLLRTITASHQST